MLGIVMLYARREAKIHNAWFLVESQLLFEPSPFNHRNPPKAHNGAPPALAVGVVASASPAATTESQEVAAARPEEEAGIVQRRCSCTQREPKANTICSLMEQATTVPAAMPCRAAANPMADPSVGSARGAGKQGIGEVPQAPLQQQHQQEPGAVQLGLGVDLDFGMVPQSDASLTLPELPLTSTRGPVAEQPQFHLVLPPIPTARRDLGELEAVPEEEESAVSAREGVNSAPAGDGRRERTRHQEQR